MAIGSWLNGLLGWFRGGYSGIDQSGSFDGIASVSAIDSATRMTALTVSRGKVMVAGDMAAYWPGLDSPRFMQLLVQDLMYCGNAVYEIDTTGKPFELRRSGHYEVTGKNKIRYRLEHHRPDGSTTKNLAADAVCHVMLNELATSPWVGVSPFSGYELVRRIERTLREQTAWPSQRIFTMPGPEFHSATPVKGGMTAAAPTVEADAETSKDRFGRPGVKVVRNLNSRGGPIPIPVSDSIFNPSQWAVLLRSDLVDEVYDAVGIPPTLRGDSVPGLAYKTALSEWIDGYLQPMVDTIAEQLSEQLEVGVRIDMSPAKIPSVVDQAKALSDLVGAGMDIQEGRRIVGFD